MEGADARHPGWVRGTSCRYAPVAFEGHAPALLARRVPVRAVAVGDGIIWGRPEPDADGGSAQIWLWRVGSRYARHFGGRGGPTMP